MSKFFLLFYQKPSMIGMGRESPLPCSEKKSYPVTEIYFVPKIEIRSKYSPYALFIENDNRAVDLSHRSRSK